MRLVPTFTRAETSLYYEVHGSGYPVLLLAPGGMRSSIPFWAKMPYSPVRELAGSFRVIAMDQRNAGQSRAPVSALDGWPTYTADHLALLDHLGIERCHLLGGCIGGAFALALAAVAPSRVSAALLQQPIGLSATNRAVFYQMFDSWADELVASRPDVARDALSAMRANLYDRDFVFSVSRDDVKRVATPLLVLRGDDVYHPSEVSEEIVHIAPRAELVRSWKEGPDVVAAVSAAKAFFAAHAGG